MINGARFLLFFWLFLALATAKADEHRRVDLKDGLQTIIVETTEGVETADMRIRVIGGQHDRRWRYRDFWLDQETKKSVELGQVEQDRYLFVHTYSGGASCCWSLLVFDLTKGKALGELLKGYSGIDMEKGSGNCPVAAVTVPELPEYSATNAGKPFKYCFDGVRFSTRRSMPSVRIQTND